MLDFFNFFGFSEHCMYIFLIILFTWIIPITILLRLISFNSNVPNFFEKSFRYCRILYLTFIIIFMIICYFFSNI